MGLFCTAVLALLVSASSLLAATATPVVIIVGCPPGSAVSTHIEITEDQNGDGTLDHRSTRDCSGKWSHDCYPVSCNAKTLWTQVASTSHHTFSSTYNSSLGIYTWVLIEYDNPTDLNETGRLERINDTTLIYTPAPPPMIDNGDSPDGVGKVTPTFNAWTFDKNLRITYNASEGGQGSIELVDILGNVVDRRAVELTKGTNDIEVERLRCPERHVYHSPYQRKRNPVSETDEVATQHFEVLVFPQDS